MKDMCLKELKRLYRHYEKEYNDTNNPYSHGMKDAFYMVIQIYKNRDFYED